LRRRLQACMHDLQNPTHAQRTITDIAFAWGFNNGAHFSRVFREHTGQTPSDFREAMRRRPLARETVRSA
ncbi:MAG: helix-turn-helix domain-containing protein, partial [Hydrogenophaga sp.]|nr:helix-turn-helix domain-containing protein [Hydrogenophaga sp.]